MEQTPNIECGAHMDYSIIRILDFTGQMGPAIRVSHKDGEWDRYLATLPAGSSEAVGLAPHLADPLPVKKRIAGSTRTDATDTAGLAKLLSAGTLPEVWIVPPGIGEDTTRHAAPPIVVQEPDSRPTESVRTEEPGGATRAITIPTVNRSIWHWW